jgi:hypothetical protein
MKLPRDVAGERLADVLCRRWQYHRVHQSGSHIILETDVPVTPANSSAEPLSAADWDVQLDSAGGVGT